MKKLNEAGIIAGLKSTNVNVVDPAEVPVIPAEPLVGLTMLIACLLGTTAGVGLAFLLEKLDTTISSPEQAELLAGMPMLSTVPHIVLHGRNGTRPLDKSEMHRPLSLVRPQSAFAESFRALRTTLLLSAPGGAPKVLVVTSAVPGEGKTTTAMNLSVALAQSKKTVLLVEADMRSPGLLELLTLGKRYGLSECLTGAADFTSAVASIAELPSLHVLAAGQRPPSPVELLGSDQMCALIARWRVEYDHVVLDTPPVMGLSDAVVLASMADAVVLVVRYARTGRQTLCRARDLLARVNAHTVGIVVNDLKLNHSEHYDYYGYYADKTLPN